MTRLIQKAIEGFNADKPDLDVRGLDLGVFLVVLMFWGLVA